jgi:hypothetical protein
MKRLRRAVANTILKGPLLSWWSGRKTKVVENICLENMARVAASPVVPAPAAVHHPAYSAVPRKILLIADVMWEMNELVPELERICQVEVCDLSPVLRTIHSEDAAPHVAAAVGKFLGELRAANPDLVLFYLRGKLLSEEVFSLLRRACKGPLIGMNLDDKATFWPCPAYRNGGDNYRRWVGHFDLNLTNSKIASTWYRDAGANVLFLPPAMLRTSCPEPSADHSFRYSVSFLGSPKVEREETFDRLRQAGIEVDIFGKGWPGSHWVDDPVKIFRSTQINLGFGLATPRLATMKNRDFECPGSGACYITTFNWELAEHWDIGKEILCYRNTEELIEMIYWYRNRPDECFAIARAAWKRARNEHTWECRFRQVFRHLGFKA